MKIEEKLKESIKNIIAKDIPSFDDSKIIISMTKDSTHGDLTSNVALIFARDYKKSPKEVATYIASLIDIDEVEKVEVAGPGFINFFVKKENITNIIKKIITEGSSFGDGEKLNKKVDIEFVSANPTGDLHLGHARGAAIGDSLSRIMSKAGYDITREYYVNDAGNQIDHLADSILVRYKELFGIEGKIPEDGYAGEDIKNIAKIFKDKYGDSLLKMDEKELHKLLKDEGSELELDKIKQDLQEFRVKFDIFSYETKVRANGRIEKMLEDLKPHTYLQDDALFLKTTDYIDDKDRVLIKADGSYTYMLPDIRYHLDKLERGYDLLIDVLGADHHGYFGRMKFSLMMFGYKTEVLDFELIQMVRLVADGIEIKMSQGTGNATTIRELVEETSVDAVRYFFVERAASSHLDFDIKLAKEQSSKNPVYYSQYAYARLCSLFRKAADMTIDETGTFLKETSELELCKHLSTFGGIVKEAAFQRAPYKITTYIHQLAAYIHQFYNGCRVISDDVNVTRSRLGLAKACQIVLKEALELVGVSAPEEM